jgi:two-component system cell cycle response regulator
MIKMSTRDEMTGLYNYRYFIETLQQELSASRRYKYDLVVCMIDIDYFKKINDNYGHPAGDDVLATFGQLLKENTRESDLPCRYGGEEFGVILTHTPIKNAFVVMERFRNIVEKTEFSYKGKMFPVTVSIGLTTLSGDNKKTLDQLIDEADQALYRAKKTGRNKTIIF